MEEDEIISRLKNGDREAYRFIIDRYQTSILNFCYRFVKNRETAEDLTQDVFIEVYKSINYFRSESKFSTWLFRIAITKSLNYLKGLKRKKRYGFIKSIFSDDKTEEFVIVSDAQNPQQIMEDQDEITRLSLAVESLPENQKVAFILCKNDELSYKEIAEILNTTVSSVESLIFRAKTNLKKKLYKFYKKQL